MDGQLCVSCVLADARVDTGDTHSKKLIHQNDTIQKTYTFSVYVNMTDICIITQSLLGVKFSKL